MTKKCSLKSGDIFPLDNVIFKRYSSLNQLFKKQWGVSLKEYSDSVVTGVDIISGTKVDYAGKDEISVLKSNGFYGFSERKKNTIHFWFDSKKVSKSDLISFFSHEMGHLVGKKIDDPIEEEKRAFTYSAVSLKTMEIVNKYLK